jgi:hypothetical protein
MEITILGKATQLPELFKSGRGIWVAKLKVLGTPVVLARDSLGDWDMQKDRSHNIY